MFRTWDGFSFFCLTTWAPLPDLKVSSDATGALGYGAISNSQWFCGAWSAEQIPLSIAYKELFPIVVAAALWLNLKTSFHASFPSNPNLCDVQCLKEYENHIFPFREVDPARPNRLVLSYIQPHKSITSETLDRWVKEALAKAGVDTNIFKAYSVWGYQLQLLTTRVFP